MEQGLASLFGYAMDNWFICLSLVGVALTAHIARDRAIVFTVTLCAITGHFLSPYFYEMNNSWKYWGLFGASVAFIKLMSIVVLIKLNDVYRTKLAELLCFIYVLQIGFHGVNHIDYAVIETEFLAAQIFSVELFGEIIKYSAYKLIVQTLNFMALLFIYGNWFLNLLNHGEKNGVRQSNSDNDTFCARVRRI